MNSLLSDSEIAIDGVALPRALIGLWSSLGIGFQLEHDLSTDAGRSSFFYWWYRNGQVHHPGLASEINRVLLSKFHTSDYLSFSESKLMSHIYMFRADIKSTYPDLSCNLHLMRFWLWWVLDGSREFGVPNLGLPLCLTSSLDSLEKIMSSLHHIVVESSSLSQLSDSPLATWLRVLKNRPSYEFDELMRRVLCTYHVANYEKCVGQRRLISPTRLLYAVYESRPDIRGNYPDLTDERDLSEFWEWWLSFGYAEYKLPNFGLPLAEHVSPSPSLAGKWSDEPQNGAIARFFYGMRRDFHLTWDSQRPQDWAQYLDWFSGAARFEGWQEEVSLEFMLDSEATSPDFSIKESSDTSGIVNIIGYPLGVFGIGEDARLIHQSLSSDVRLKEYSVELYQSSRNVAHRVSSDINCKPISNLRKNGINIYCMPAFDTIALLHDIGYKALTARYRIGLWQWELDRFPGEAESCFDLVDEIWSISSFAAQSISRATSKPVFTLPLPFSVDEQGSFTRRHFGIPESAFVFYTAFDGNSFIARKNPLAAIQAFFRAFGDRAENVFFVIKAMNINGDALWRECLRLASLDDRVLIIDEVMSRDKVASLMGLSNCFVSLHRAEGFGRLIVEAMLQCKPVIVSGYSGNMDYVDESTGYLVQGRLVPIFRGDYPFYSEGRWFNPDVDDAARKFREVYSNQTAALEKAKRAKDSVVKKYSFKACAEFMANRLSEIESKIKRS